MKNQTLAQVFGIVLLIMCLLMAVNGAVAFGKNNGEHIERTEFQTKFRQRIDNFKELDARLANSISYDEAYAELEKRLEEHDGIAADHRTDLAMYSAEKGGNTMGANALLEALPQVKGAKQQLEAGKAELEIKKAEFQQQKAWYESSKSAIDGAAAQCSNDAAACAAAASEVGGVIEAVSAMPQTVSDPGESPETPVHPGDAPVPPSEDAPDEEKQAYETALAEYNTKLEEYNSKTAALEKYNSDIQKYRKYVSDMGEWSVKYGAIAAKASSPDWIAGIGAIMADSSAHLQSAAALIPESMLAQYGGSIPTGEGGTPPTTLPEFQATLNQLAGALTQVSASLGGIGAGIAAGEAAIAEGEAKLVAGEKELAEAEHQVVSNLELIWYKLDRLEQDKAELEEEKQSLDEENEKLSKELMETEELRELENKRTSAKLLLTSVAKVKQMFDENGELAESAETYLADYIVETDRLYYGKLVMSILMLLGGAAGIAGIPGAFEKTKKRLWLLLPVILCLVCAAAADGIYMYLGLGQMYTALFSAIFAFIQLLVIIPRKQV